MISIKAIWRALFGAPISDPNQVQDELAILDDSLHRLKTADTLYHPGPYWLRHQQPLVKHIRRNGLANYRSGRGGRKDPSFIFNRFGAAEPLVKPPDAAQSQEEWNTYRYQLAAEYGRKLNAKPLSSLSISTIGDPGDAFTIDGNNYTHLALNCYMRYAYLSQFVDFETIRTLVEIGPGSGIQTEVLHKLYPHLSSYLFDIPPQSYVRNQYLKAVFGAQVVPLESTASWQDTASRAGNIYVYNSWQFPIVANLEIDLFWNAASFNEMQPHLVDNYLSYVRLSAKSIYLMSIMQGSNVGRSDYQFSLPMYQCEDCTPLPLPGGGLSDRYFNSFWKRSLSQEPIGTWT